MLMFSSACTLIGIVCVIGSLAYTDNPSTRANIISAITLISPVLIILALYAGITHWLNTRKTTHDTTDDT